MAIRPSYNWIQQPIGVKQPSRCWPWLLQSRGTTTIATRAYGAWLQNKENSAQGVSPVYMNHPIPPPSSRRRRARRVGWGNLNQIGLTPYLLLCRPCRANSSVADLPFYRWTPFKPSKKVVKQQKVAEKFGSFIFISYFCSLHLQVAQLAWASEPIEFGSAFVTIYRKAFTMRFVHDD